MIGPQVLPPIFNFALSFLGYDDKHNTWEPMENLFCHEMIKEFEENLLNKNQLKSWKTDTRLVEKLASFINTFLLDIFCAIYVR